MTETSGGTLSEQDTRRRVVDAHVHHWDPANPAWYFYLSPEVDGVFPEFGDYTAMKRRYDRDIYRADAANWRVEEYVHVTAAAGPRTYLGETAEMAQLAAKTGDPSAIIGSVDPSLPVAEMAADLDEQATQPGFRGIRIIEPLDYGSEHTIALLRLLAERGLVYDLVVTPPQMLDAVRGLAQVPDLSVVVEHTGRPMVADDPDHFRQWQDGMTSLASLGDRVTCKFSGLAMTLHAFSADSFARWFEQCITIFGTDRCFFASNFPVDALWGTFDELYTVYEGLSAPLGEAAQDALFYGNARRVYRC